ncbi:MAG: NAD-dependent epimerase/dehydratase family protein [Anaerolineales bacterium]
MTILATGGAGFIGSYVVDLYLQEGHDVVVLDSLSTGRRSNLNQEARVYEMDIRDPAVRKVFERERPEVVNHHAAQMDVRRSVADPLFDAQVNILGSLNNGGERAPVGVALARPAGSVPSGWPRTKGSAKEEGEP